MSLETGGSQKQKTRTRVLWISGLLVLLVATGLVVMNMGASEANGADAPDTDSADSADKNGDSEGEDEKGKAPVPVEVAAVKEGPISAYISTTANLVAENEVHLLSEVEGRVARLLVEEGDYVREGQALATLVRDDQEINLRKTELKETNARLAFERGEDLIAKELISREEFDKFKMDFDIAQQEKAEAAWRLQKTTIKAPFAGQISERMIQVGQNLRMSDEMFRLTDIDPLIARIFLPERDVLGMEQGGEVRITLNADTETRFNGRIRQVSPVVDTATGTIKVTVEAVNPPKDVRSGSFVTVDIVRETRAAAMLVPREAVLRELQSAHVFVFSGDGKAEKRLVELGLEEGLWVEAVHGVGVGDNVIVAGQGGLKEGAAVKLVGVDDADADAKAAAKAADYQRLKKTDGSLFKGRYKAVLVQPEKYLLPLTRYIHTRVKPSEVKASPWTSCRYFIEKSKPPSWFKRDETLTRLAVAPAKRLAAYTAYLDLGIDEEIAHFYGKKNLSSVMGDDKFKQQAQKKRSATKTRGVSRGAKAKWRPSCKQIITDVAKQFKVTESSIYNAARGPGSKNVPRWIAMYLCQELSAVTLQAIAKLFKLKRYGTVSTTVGKLKEEFAQNPSLLATTERIAKRLSKGK